MQQVQSASSCEVADGALCNAHSVSRESCECTAAAEMRALLMWMLGQDSRHHTESCEDKVYHWDGQWKLHPLQLQSAGVHALQQ